MTVFAKLDKALDHGMFVLDEVVQLVRVARELLLELRPTVAALPALVRSAQEVLAQGHRLLQAENTRRDGA